MLKKQKPEKTLSFSSMADLQAECKLEIKAAWLSIEEGSPNRANLQRQSFIFSSNIQGKIYSSTSWSQSKELDFRTMYEQTIYSLKTINESY